MNTFLASLDNLYLDNSLTQWLRALGTAAVVMLVTMLIRRVVRRHYKRMSTTSAVELLEVPLQIASQTTSIFLIAVSVFAGMLTLTLPAVVHRVAEKILIIVTCWQAGLWLTSAALAWLTHRRTASLTHDRAAAGTLGIVAIIVRMVIWSVVLLLTLDNLGVNITTLVAGFGIGGIAVALAVQNVLGDLLASLSITLDKPFVVGDALAVDTFNGTVEQIGLKTTRLRSVDGEQIIMPNADLLKSRVRNYGRMNERRVLFTLSIPYETPRAKLQKIPTMVRDIVSSQAKVRMDRCHLARLGTSAIECEVVYFMLNSDYNLYMDTQQEIILRLVEAFEREELEFAYPTTKQWAAAVAGPEEQPTESSGPRA